MNKYLENKLSSWQKAGVLSQEQIHQIREYEESNDSTINLAVYSIIGLGIVAISIGVISLIAFNWDAIPGLVKLAIDFFLLIVIAFFLFRFKSTGQERFYEMLNLFYLIFVLASIGLISQVYHTGGEFYMATGLWTIITFPLILYSRGRLSIHLWVLAAVFSGVSFYVESFRSIDEFWKILSIINFLPFGLFSSYVLSKYLTKKTDNHPFPSTFLFWSILIFLIGTIILSINAYSKVDKISYHTFYYYTMLATLPMIGLSIWYSHTISSKNIILSSSLAVLYELFVFLNFSKGSSEIINAVLFILIWFNLGFIFNPSISRRFFEFLMVGIGIRFIVIYFQIFGNLAFTGFYLIFSGVLIIIISILYIKNREKLITLFNKLL